jgi:CRISP-associated protein Cas1
MLNPFNLVDDLIEPLRAFVDLKVLEYTRSNALEDIKDIKNGLIELLNSFVLFKNEKLTLIHCIQMYSQGFVNAIKKKDCSALCFPEFSQ